MKTSPDTIRRILGVISQENCLVLDDNGKIVDDFDGFILTEPWLIMIYKKEIRRVLGLFKQTTYKKVGALRLPDSEKHAWQFCYPKGINRDEKLLSMRLAAIIANKCMISIRYR